MKYLLSLVLACIFITNAFSQKPVAPAISDSLTDPTWTACTSASPILRYTSSGTSSLFSCTGVGGHKICCTDRTSIMSGLYNLFSMLK